MILVWIVTGLVFGLNDTCRLVMNSGTMIITFLMVFLIKNSQSRDTCVIQVKQDELVRVTDGVHNALLDLEELSARDLDAFCRKCQALAIAARQQITTGGRDTEVPEA